MIPVEYINPWFAGAKGQAKKFMATTRPTKYRGFKVYRQALGQYDYVFEGICVKQLGAFKMYAAADAERAEARRKRQKKGKP